MTHTVNELLVLKSHLSARHSELTRLRYETSRRKVETKKIDDITYETLDESRYDPNDIELKISELANAIYEIDRAIKVINAKTTITIEGIDVRGLMAPIPPRPWQPTK